MSHGFVLFIDESGDDGVERVRPTDSDGASEYFVLCGVLVRSGRTNALAAHVQSFKAKHGLQANRPLHFRDLSGELQGALVRHLASFNVGIVTVVSNKRNVRGYRNHRVEAKSYHINRKGFREIKKRNWFYNNAFKYLIESASEECARWSNRLYGEYRPIKIVFSHREGFDYLQTRNYLRWLKLNPRPSSYFNNKRRINWSVVDPNFLDSARAQQEAGLEVADCFASAIYQSIDVDMLGSIRPSLIENISHLFIRPGNTGSPKDYGVKLLPEAFAAPLTFEQKQSLRACGYEFY